jgi:osmotically inducible protein OsmC
MPTRSANAVWEGTLKEGKGRMKFATFEGPYTFASRFESGAGTNPEELIGAAHAGCFSMKFSGVLEKAGFPPKQINTTARVTIEGGRIQTVELNTEAQVPGIDDARFQQCADEAKRTCPVSQALTGVDIKLQARLAG